ncbi:MAG: glycoside hydrolase family 38 C-terminal domain-containing protein [Blastocatellia bacterium]
MTEKKQTPMTIHLISHNHWDREWIFTARYTNRWLPPFFENVFKMLEREPGYRFVLDGQTAIIGDCLGQLSPSEAEHCEKQIQRFVGEGRLLIGPAYLQPDWGLVSGEALVRNLLIGHKIASRYGGVMKAGWMIDNFGQIGQAPQIYRGFGIDGVYVWRGVDMGSEEIKSEFLWKSPDDSQVLAIYLINSYRNGMVLSLTREIALERIHAEALALEPFATSPNVLLMNGYEQVPWPDDVLPIIAEFNLGRKDGSHCVQSTPQEYLEAVRATTAGLPVIQGYFYSGRYMPVLKGVFSSRSQLKLLNNECQRELERWAEPFATIAWTLGADYPKEKLETAWKTLLLNHAHDDMCGCCIDDIARDMEARFEQVYQTAAEITEASLKAISNAANTCCDDSVSSLVVFNPSARARSEVVGFSMELPAGLESFTLTDGRGGIAPYQIARRDGGKADLFVYVNDVPSLGYKTWYVKAGASGDERRPATGPARVRASAASRTLENEYLLVAINDDGSFNLTDKQTGRTHANLGYFEDGGDAGDTYDYSWPPRDAVITSLGKQAEITLLEEGPLLARFRVAITMRLPESLRADRQERSETTRAYPLVSYVELTAGARRVEIKTRLKNVVKDHRLRALFPSGISSDYCYAEEPFDIARMPVHDDSSERQLAEKVQKLLLAGRYTVPVNTHPFQNFIDYSDDQHGLAIISRRGTEFEILPENGAIALTLLRAVGWLTRYDLLTRTGDVGPHIFTPEAQCPGEHTFYYAVYPHSQGWPEDNTHLEAFSHNLRLRIMQSHDPGSLPDELSFLSLAARDASNACRLTALKRAESGDGVLVRFFNTLEKGVRADMKFWWPCKDGVAQTNLNEEEQQELKASAGAFHLPARQKEIVTVKIRTLPQLLLDVGRSSETRLLPPLAPVDNIPEAAGPPVLTLEEVRAESDRARGLEEALLKARAEVFLLEDEIERTAARDVASRYELQRRKVAVATLTRQHNEARISELLNRRLYDHLRIENELEGIGEAMSWSRTKKRAGEYLLHYYEGLLQRDRKERE